MIRALLHSFKQRFYASPAPSPSAPPIYIDLDRRDFSFADAEIAFLERFRLASRGSTLFVADRLGLGVNPDSWRQLQLAELAKFLHAYLVEERISELWSSRLPAEFVTWLAAGEVPALPPGVLNRRTIAA